MHQIYQNKCLAIKISKTVVIIYLYMCFILFLFHFMGQVGSI